MIDKEDIVIETYPPIPSSMHHNGPRPGIIIHHKSKISVASQAYRSQHHNKAECIWMLETILEELDT